MQIRTPIAPTTSRALGAPGGTLQTTRFPALEGSGYTTAAPKGHSKGGSDPSMGSMVPRAASMERTGAQFRVRQDVFGGIAPPNEPYSAAQMANTPVVQDAAVPTPDKNYHAGTNASVMGHVVMSRDGSAPYLGEPKER